MLSKNYPLFLLKFHILFDLVWIFYLRSRTLLRINKERRVYSSRDGFFSTRLAHYYFLECLVILPHPNIYFIDSSIFLPSLNQNLQICYRINHLLSLCMTFRLLFLARIYLNLSTFRTSRSFRLW